MPIPSFKRKKIAALPSDASVQDQPLMYAQPSYAPSEKDTVIRSPPTIRPVTHKAISKDVFADVTYYKEQQAKKAAAAKAKAEVRGLEGAETNVETEEVFERPATPPQGNRSIPWDSYHDLPADHPVFLYPDDVREKMYKKSIDPVVRAMADKSLRGITYGTKTNPVKSSWKRGQGMLNQCGNMSVGAWSG